MADVIKRELISSNDGDDEFDEDMDIATERPFFHEEHAATTMDECYEFFGNGEFCDLILEADEDKKR